MMGLGTAKLIGLGVAALFLIGILFGLRHYKNLAEDRGEKLAVICQTTRQASGQPRLNCGEVPAQITFMGEAVKTLSGALDRQNKAVDALNKENERLQADYARASRIAQERSSRVAATSGGLMASSRSSERQAKPCEPSRALREAWQ